MQNSAPIKFAFTTKYNGISNRLNTTAMVCCGDLKENVNALWDTGATATCIAKELVSKLNLIPTGYQRIQTPSGSSIVGTYLVNIILPNNVTINDVKVCESEIGSQGLGVLIGMDIISLGDFCVSSYKGETWFTFCTPSTKHTDYVEQINLEKMIGRRGKGKRKKK